MLMKSTYSDNCSLQMVPFFVCILQLAVIAWACCSGASLPVAFGFQFAIELGTPLGVPRSVTPRGSWPPKLLAQS